MSNLYDASAQWATRPDDQRFLTLDDLKKSVEQRKKESWTVGEEVGKIRVVHSKNELDVLIDVFDPTQSKHKLLSPTNFAFGQLAQYANAPAGYLRKLPAPLAAINLQYGIEKNPIRDNVLVLGQTNGHNTLRAMTSQSYGRIWDIEVVNAVQKVNKNGVWKVPSASYATQSPKRATTLYASDRDVFIFLVDEEHPVEYKGEKLFRGFFTWNSEVGSATFGLKTFLYRFVCDNRIIWDVSNVKELTIRHTGGAPERFAYEGAKYLKQYANESTIEVVDVIKKAQKYELPEAEKPGKGWESWLSSHGFNKSEAKQAVQSAIAEEGEARSLWDIVNGVTAYARTIPHTDERVRVETLGGKLLNYAANK